MLLFSLFKFMIIVTYFFFRCFFTVYCSLFFFFVIIFVVLSLNFFTSTPELYQFKLLAFFLSTPNKLFLITLYSRINRISVSPTHIASQWTYSNEAFCREWENVIIYCIEFLSTHTIQRHETKPTENGKKDKIFCLLLLLCEKCIKCIKCIEAITNNIFMVIYWNVCCAPFISSYCDVIEIWMLNSNKLFNRNHSSTRNSIPNIHITICVVYIIIIT